MSLSNEPGRCSACGAVLGAALALVACGGSQKRIVAPSTQPATNSRFVIGEPAPERVVSERSFLLPIDGEVLAARRLEAAVRVPLIYTHRPPRRGLGAHKARVIRELRRWHRKVSRARVRNMKQFEKAYAAHGKVLGVQLDQKSFDKLRRVKRWKLGAAFAKIIRQALPPYLIAKRGLAEKRAKSPFVIVRKEGRRKRWRERELDRKEISTVDEARSKVRRIVEEQAAKLDAGAREALVEIVAAQIKSTLKLDRTRTRAAWVEARSKVKRTPMTFAKGQTIVKAGERFSAEHRAIIAQMRSVRCEPCPGGATNCSGGLLKRLRLGGKVLRPIKATRSFLVPLDEERKQVIRAQAKEMVPPVYSVDRKVGAKRVAKLKRVLTQAGRAEGDKRWDRFLGGLEEKLGAKVLEQLTESLEALPWKDLQTALLALYQHAQAEPITAGKPVASSARCTLREVSRGAPRERTVASCPVLPLARLRLDLPLRAGEYISLLAKMPSEAQRSLIELVQYLLVENTTYDESETKSRRDKAAAEAKGEERLYIKGDIVFPAGAPLTRVHRHTLEKMFSVRCRPAP